MNDHAKNVRDYLNELCARMDRGEEPKRIRKAWWRVPSAVAVGLSLASCGGTADELGQSEAAVCSDGVDDDAISDVDCDDTECAKLSDCDLSEAYARSKEKCDNFEDDDGDNLVDCLDPDCKTFPDCVFSPAYAAPAE